MSDCNLLGKQELRESQASNQNSAFWYQRFSGHLTATLSAERRLDIRSSFLSVSESSEISAC